MTFSIALHCIFFWQGLSLNLEFTNSARLAGKQACDSLLFPVQYRDSWSIPLSLAFYMPARDLKSFFFMFAWQSLYQPVIFQIPPSITLLNESSGYHRKEWVSLWHFYIYYIIFCCYLPSPLLISFCWSPSPPQILLNLLLRHIYPITFSLRCA